MQGYGISLTVMHIFLLISWSISAGLDQYLYCVEFVTKNFNPFNPSEPGDEGECPRLPADAVGICVTECESDRDCGRNKKCCSNGCGQVCKEQVKTYNEGKFQIPNFICQFIGKPQADTFARNC